MKIKYFILALLHLAVSSSTKMQLDLVVERPLPLVGVTSTASLIDGWF